MNRGPRLPNGQDGEPRTGNREQRERRELQTAQRPPTAACCGCPLTAGATTAGGQSERSRAAPRVPAKWADEESQAPRQRGLGRGQTGEAEPGVVPPWSSASAATSDQHRRAATSTRDQYQRPALYRDDRDSSTAALRASARNDRRSSVSSVFPVPCSLFPVPCSLFPVPYFPSLPARAARRNSMSNGFTTSVRSMCGRCPARSIG